MLHYLHFTTAIRKLIEQRRHVEGKQERRNIINEYTNFDSQVYAPMTHIGIYLDANSEQYTIKSQYNTTLNGTLYTHYIYDNIMQ